MRKVIPLIFVVIFALPAWSQDLAAAPGEMPETQLEVVDTLAPLDATDLNLADFLWLSRPIVVFADTPRDPRFIEQMALLAERPEPLLERDVVIITDTDPAARSAIRLNLRPRGFGLVLMDKDGTVNLRRPSPRNVREIIRAIDNMPIRMEEMQTGG